MYLKNKGWTRYLSARLNQTTLRPLMFQKENFARLWQAREEYEALIQSEISRANRIAKHQCYPDEMPVRLYPTSLFTAE